MPVRTSALFSVIAAFLCIILFAQCSSLYKDFDEKELKTNSEFDQVVKIEKIEPEPMPEESKKDIPAIKKEEKEPAKKKAKEKKSAGKKTVEKSGAIEKKSPAQPEQAQRIASGKSKKKEPSLEDSEGWNGRRPDVEPFRVGEKTVWSVTYFGVEAGKFTMQVNPFVQVNGRKCYHFKYLVKTSSLFSMFYAVDDIAETFVDYELWRPLSYEIHVKESKQVRETRTYFDWKKKRGFYWDKKKYPDRPLEEKKMEWDLPPWSQNVFSVAYYLRAHTLKVGKTLKVRVAHEGKNMVMAAKVLRKEVIDTKAGRFPAYVIRPTFTVSGIFKPTGDNLIWISADDRKFILRVESKIRIGTIVAMVDTLKK